jgi:hypothetical protein
MWDFLVSGLRTGASTDPGCMVRAVAIEAQGEKLRPSWIVEPGGVPPCKEDTCAGWGRLPIVGAPSSEETVTQEGTSHHQENDENPKKRGEGKNFDT